MGTRRMYGYLPSLLDVGLDQVDAATMAAPGGFRRALGMQNIDPDLDARYGLPEAYARGAAALVAQRLREAGVSVTIGAVLFCGWASNGPVKATLWAYTLKCLHDRLRRAVTLSDLADAFPRGLPSDAAVGRIWDAQRSLSGNLLEQNWPWERPLVH